MSILDDVAEAMAEADMAPKKVAWHDLTPEAKARYRVMAAAALAVRLTEYPDITFAL